MEQQRADCAARDRRLVDPAASRGAAFVHRPAVPGGDGGSLGRESEEVDATECETVRRQAEVWIRRGAEGADTS